MTLEPPSPTLSDSALLDSLDDDPRFDLGAHRERRMEELQAEVRKVQNLRESEYGRMITFTDEKGLIERMAKEKFCILNFVHPDFERCGIMNRKLEELAPKYIHTLFLSTSVSDSPFLVSKFGVKVLPCVLIFVDGRCADRLIGFEDLGHTDKFTTKALELRLLQSGALTTAPISLANTGSTAVIGEGASGDEDSDDERDRRKGLRGGKTGIRNGFASRQMDSDED